MAALLGNRGGALALALALATLQLLGPEPRPAAAAAHPASSEETAAFSPEVTYTGDVAWIIEGMAPGVVCLDDIDVTLLARLAPLLGWQGASVFLYGLGNQGGRPSRHVGDAQGVDNIEAPTSWKLYEAWFEQLLFEEHLSLLAGLYDLNSEFDHLRSTDVFLNASQGINPTLGLSGRNGPSVFPTTSLGARARTVLLERRLYLQGALLDGVPGDPEHPRGTHVEFGAHDGLLLVAEIGLQIGFPAGPSNAVRARRARRRRVTREDGANLYAFKAAVGAWYYSAAFPVLASDSAGGRLVEQTGNVGAYFDLGSVVYREPGSPAQGLVVHGRLAWANPKFNRFAWFAGGGLLYTGALPSRDRDEAGAALSVAGNGDRYLEAQRLAGIATEAAEIALELTYLGRVTERVSLQLDGQRVWFPDTSAHPAAATIVTTRLQVEF